MSRVRLSLLALAILALAPFSNAASANQPCACVAAAVKPGQGGYAEVRLLQSMGQALNSAACESNCRVWAQNGMTAALKTNVETSVCSQGFQRYPGMPVKVLSRWGATTPTYAEVKHIGDLVVVAPTTTTACACTAGYAASGSPKRCYKEASGVLTVTPHPADGTAVGTYGIIMGGKVLHKGTDPVCTTTQTSPGTCKF